MARIIDGEKLKKEVASTFHGAIGLTVTGAVHEIIDRQPTVDPESLRLRAHWDGAEGYNYHVCCSNCGVIFQSWAAFCNYCPNCGAKMEDESDES